MSGPARNTKRKRTTGSLEEGDPLHQLAMENACSIFVRFERWCAKSLTPSPFSSIRAFYTGVLDEDDLDALVAFYDRQMKDS
mmetsp:Transcript_4681/g.11986  ORF Transcript_4681/g.11986 Transcript_4681/m.11986 type:complete len:82 (-) Transcript_4681:43-288(-)